MQTILGSGGIIGHEASFCLAEFTDKVRQVSRYPKKVNENDQVFPADLKVESEVRQAVKGSAVVYLTVGLPYDTDIWVKYWPIIMQNTINACKEHQSKLVFFDNVYMYGKVDGWMTEETPFNPCSKKGEVRAKVASMLLEEIKKGNINAQIARAADFYGPRAKNTYITPMVFDKLSKGKKPQLMLNAHTKHSYTFTPDAARSIVLLGNTEEAFGQTWHLPTDHNALSGADFVKTAAITFGANGQHTVLTPLMIKMASLFSPAIKETKEMLYQFKYDYLFDSSKFQKYFFDATSYQKGIDIVFKTQYKRNQTN